MAYKLGTLVRVKDSAWDNFDYVHARSNRSLVRDHGYLWIVTDIETSSTGSAYLCRSVSTGHNGAVWIDREIEGADDGI